MEDNKVGELWRECLMLGPGVWTNRTMDLIRKLVEERRLRWESIITAQGRAHGLSPLTMALNEFGIVPETWKP